MKMLKKLLAVLLVFLFVFALFGCAGKGKKAAAYEDWFVNKYEPAYEAFINSGKAENVPSSDLSLLIASDDYVKAVFAFMKDGSVPPGAEITEKDGVYTYSYGLFDQVIEFSKEKTAMKITMHQYDDTDGRVEFIATFAQQGGHYYLQFLAPLFRDYAEVRFTEKNGRSMRSGEYAELPYDIFSADIPSDFAKEK